MYDIDIDKIEKRNKQYAKPGLLSVILLIITSFLVFMVFGLIIVYGIIALPLLILPVIPTATTYYNYSKKICKIDDIQDLKENGVLIKNIPCQVVSLSFEFNQITINYTLPNKSKVKLRSGPLSKNECPNTVNTADLIIDKYDINIYYIDTCINRISGNLPTDYFVDQAKGNDKGASLFKNLEIKKNK